MTDPDEAKIEAYKKLFKEKGIKKALDEIEKSGITYNDNFTKSHKSDPIFSSPLIQISNLQIPKFIGVDMSFVESVDANNSQAISFQPPINPTRIPTVTPNFNLSDCILVEEEPVPNRSDIIPVPISPVEVNVSI